MSIWQAPQTLTTCDDDCQMGLRLLAKLAERPEQPPLGWTNVSVALAFILFDVGLSTVFRLGLGVSLVVAAGRCMGQLTVVATLLHEVFENRNPRTVALIACEFFLLYTGLKHVVMPRDGWWPSTPPRYSNSSVAHPA
jgi:hypothetical protein